MFGLTNPMYWIQLIVSGMTLLSLTVDTIVKTNRGAEVLLDSFVTAAVYGALAMTCVLILFSLARKRYHDLRKLMWNIFALLTLFVSVDMLVSQGARDGLWIMTLMLSLIGVVCFISTETDDHTDADIFAGDDFL